MFYVVFLDQSDSFFHCQCLECPALADRPCVGRCAGSRDVNRVRGETHGAGAWRGSGPGNGPAAGDLVLTGRRRCGRASRRPTVRALCTCAPAHIPPDQRERGLLKEPGLLPLPRFPGSSAWSLFASPAVQPSSPVGGGGACGAIPRMLLALSRWSPFISHVHFNELHAHQPRAITILTDGPVG